MSVFSQNMGYRQLCALQEWVNEAVPVYNSYGEWFTDAVGVDKLVKLHEVNAKEVKLDTDQESIDWVTPDLFKEPAVRGTGGKSRPFVAIKLELLNPKTREVIDTIVLLVLKRNHWSKQDFITASTCKGASGKTYNCPINGANGLNLEQVDHVRRLLDGITVEHDGGRIVSGGYSLRMVKA